MITAPFHELASVHCSYHSVVPAKMRKDVSNSDQRRPYHVRSEIETSTSSGNLDYFIVSFSEILA